MLDLAFADDDMIGKGRSFDCSTCHKNIKKLRRCEEDRWDLNHEDGIIFPIEVFKGGQKYGFCPGKVTWASEFHTKRIFDLLVLSCDTKHLLYSGGLMEQPSWFVSRLSWFAPRYNALKNAIEQKNMWGSSGSNNRHTKRQDTNRRKGR